MRKLHLFVLSLGLLLSCSKSKCPDDDIGIEFNILIGLISESGEILLDNPDFNLDQLKIIDIETQFSSNIEKVVTNNQGEKTIVYSPIGQRKLIFKYNDETVGSFEIRDVVQPIDDCILKTKSYTVFSKDELICKCNIDDKFIIQLTI